MKKFAVRLLCCFLALLLCSCTARQTSADTDDTTAEAVTDGVTQTSPEQTAEPETEPATVTEAETEPPEDEVKYVNYADMKAMWISQFDMANVYVKNGKQRSEAEFTKLLKRMLDNVASNHYNTIIFQVRPYADSMYPSDVCPPCYIASGGYGTELSNNGANLSQGQRQLLAIARAAVADPPVMILDEATSSIDTRTEAIVQRGMDKLMEGRTVFVIAHRLSTVMDADVIMVLDHGRIIERGSHERLIAEKGTYYQLYTGAFELE